MLGFAFSLVGEVLTGKGALAQLGYEVRQILHTLVPLFCRYETWSNFTRCCCCCC